MASGQGRLLVCDGFRYLFGLLWSECFSGIFGDLILESLSMKECDKMPAHGRGGGCLGCLCTAFADRRGWGGLKRVSDLPRVPLEASEPGQRLTVLGQNCLPPSAD